jgi:hypothetical protein
MASTFDITKNIDTTNKKLIYDYYPIIINKDDYSTSTYVTINTVFKPNAPNLLYPDTMNSYNATKIYITKLIHNNIAQIQSSNVIGELIIEHTPITGTGKYYTCFLLESNPKIKFTDSNSVDDLIYKINKKNTNISFALNTSIPSQNNCIVYNINNTDKVFVFTNMIYLNNKSYDYITKKITGTLSTTTLPKYATYTVLPKNNITQQGEDEIYIDCTPTGESAETIATYNVPIQSEYTRDASKLDFMKTLINLMMFFIFILITYFTVPFFYKTVVVDNIHKLIKGDDHDKNRRNVAVDVFMCIVAVVLFFTMLGYGMNKNFEFVMYAVYFFVFFGLSASIVGYNREIGFFKDKYRDIYKKFVEDPNNKDSPKILKFIDILKELGQYIIEVVQFDVFGKGETKPIIAMFATFILFLIIILPIWLTKKISKTVFIFLMWFIPVFVILPGVSIISLTMLPRGDKIDIS